MSERNVTTEVPVHEILIDSKSPENKADLEEYILAMLEKDRARVDALTASWTGKLEDLASAIHDRASGNFMYVHHAIPALLGPGKKPWKSDWQHCRQGWNLTTTAISA